MMKRANLIMIFSAFLFLIGTSPVKATDSRVSAELNPFDSVMIGDHIILTLTAIVPKGSDVIWPVSIDTLTNFDILELGGIDTAEEETGDLLKLSQSITVSAYDSGVYGMAGIPFRIIAFGDTENLSTIPLALRVNTLSVDTSQTFKAIKPPIEIPLSFADIWPWVLAVILIFGLAGLTYYLVKRKSTAIPTEQKVVLQMPPHMVATKKLDELERKKLWQQDKTKDYYIELTDIVREYLENRFKILALESTTDEIIRSLEKVHSQVENISKLEEVLSLADLVKFAKVKPLSDENSKSMSIAREFIRKNIPVIAENPKEVVNV